MKEKFYFFGDRPIKETEQDSFLAEYQVNTLERIIFSLLDRKEAFNIGIYGRWGVGKTSIINLLKKRIEEDVKLKNKIDFVVFNVWKYSGDSLMRQFLLFLDSREGLNTKLDVKKELEKTTGKSTLKIKFNVTYLIASILLAIILFLMLNFISLGIKDTFTQLVVSLITVILYVFYEVLKQGVQKSQTTTETKHRLDKPDQFEQKFKEILQKAQTKGKKIIIVIDDLDRCSADKVIEMLGIVKNFLDIENCIYIIPCDDGAIKKHLETVMRYDNSKASDANEFLKKFFQIALRIPPYIDEDLFTYTHELAEKSGFSKGVEEVIIRAFWESPRQIKQFLNNLNALRIQAEEKERRSLLRKGVITNNLQFLAKIEAIRERWPSVYEEIIKDERYLKLLENHIHGREIGDVPNKIKDTIKNQVEKTPELESFLYSTIDVQATDVAPFLTLGQPEYMISIKDEELTSLLAIVSTPSSFQKKFQESEKKEPIVKTLLELMKRRKHSGYHSDVFDTVRALIELYPHIEKPNLKKTVSNRVAEELGLRQMKPNLKFLDYNKTFALLKGGETNRVEKVLLPLTDLIKLPEGN